MEKPKIKGMRERVDFISSGVSTKTIHLEKSCMDSFILTEGGLKTVNNGEPKYEDPPVID